MKLTQEEETKLAEARKVLAEVIEIFEKSGQLNHTEVLVFSIDANWEVEVINIGAMARRLNREPNYCNHANDHGLDEQRHSHGC